LAASDSLSAEHPNVAASERQTQSGRSRTMSGCAGGKGATIKQQSEIFAQSVHQTLTTSATVVLDGASISHSRSGRLIMHVNKVHHVTTINGWFLTGAGYTSPVPHCS